MILTAATTAQESKLSLLLLRIHSRQEKVGWTSTDVAYNRSWEASGHHGRDI